MLVRVIVDIVHDNVKHDFTYRVPAGMHLVPGQRVLVPFGRQKKEAIVLGLTEHTDLAPEKLRMVEAALEDYPAVLPALMRLAEHLAEENRCPLAETLRLMLPAEMRGGRVQVKTKPVAVLAIDAAGLDAAVEAQGRSGKRKLLLRLLADGQPHDVADLAMVVREPLIPLRQLEQQRLIRIELQESLRRPGGFPTEAAEDPPLTAQQTEALQVMLPFLRQGKGRFLLHGVTGSGKTEVFIRLVRETLRMGRSAMILVPEIALTPQMVSWFRARFGSVAAVLHSRLSAGERFDEWRRIRRGDAKVVIGARSAVFAPMEHPGLIVVDEEHETTYLSDRHPRYDARSVAAFRCEGEGATLLLASATPSILSFAMARRGDYTLLEMPQRVHRKPLPAVELVDMRQELELGNRSVLSLRLQQALKTCVAAGQQAMLLMNRRGYNTFVSCRKCGQVIKCPQCDVSMTYHIGQTDNRLHCHYCGYETEVPTACPACGSRYIRHFGAGTQKVEEEVKRLLPGVGVVRMDLDTTSGKGGHEKLLDEFRSGRARVLVGTQMIAKGLDFPMVTLVGVVAADLTLNLPDYRSRERTFQLLTQVAGRAGRGELPGQVILQTYKPEDPVLALSAAQDYRGFFEREFDLRRRRLYPPFTAMARLLVESPSEERAVSACDRLLAACERALDEHRLWKKRTLLCMADRPSIKQLRGKYRAHVVLKLLVHPDADGLIAYLTDLARASEEPGAEVFFELNPINMY